MTEIPVQHLVLIERGTSRVSGAMVADRMPLSLRRCYLWGAPLIPNTDDPEVRALSRRIRAVQPYWHAEAIDRVARATVAGNRAYGLALDSNDSLARDINAFFAKDRTMPMTTASPASMSPDNLTGRHHYRRRTHAADQGRSVQELLELVGSTLHSWSDAEVDEFVTGLNNLLSANGKPAEDQGSSLRLACWSRRPAR